MHMGYTTLLPENTYSVKICRSTIDAQLQGCNQKCCEFVSVTLFFVGFNWVQNVIYLTFFSYNIIPRHTIFEVSKMSEKCRFVGGNLKEYQHKL